jgi:hypothetical protein
MLTCLLHPAFSQQGSQRNYKGVVTDSAGMAIPGASVV